YHKDSGHDAPNKRFRRNNFVNERNQAQNNETAHKRASQRAPHILTGHWFFSDKVDGEDCFGPLAHNLAVGGHGQLVQSTLREFVALRRVGVRYRACQRQRWARPSNSPRRGTKQRYGLAAIAKRVGLGRQADDWIEDDPAPPEAALAAWGL